MREYEVTIILQPELSDEEREEIVERIKGWLLSGKDGAEILLEDRWGKRTLAYPIRKFTEGFYVYFDVKMDPLVVNEAERNISYVEDILRHLIIRKEE